MNNDILQALFSVISPQFLSFPIVENAHENLEKQLKNNNKCITD